MNRHKLQMILYGALISTVLQGCAFNDGFRRIEGKSSVQINEEEKESDEKSEAKYFIGEICLVQRSLGFVLIKSSKLKPPKGTILHVIQEGEITSKAKLRVSPERRPGFIVADIIAGEPTLGDWVFFKVESPQNDGGVDVSLHSSVSQQLHGLLDNSIPEDPSKSKVLND